MLVSDKVKEAMEATEEKHALTADLSRIICYTSKRWA